MMINFLKKIIARFVQIGLNEIKRGEYMRLRKKYKIPDSFRFNGNSILIYGEGMLIIGENSYIGSYSTIQIGKDCEVIIGDNCRISHNVRIYTTTAISDQEFSDRAKVIHRPSSVNIGNGVWIGANVFINPGISIGENAIVGANSVVTKDVEPHAIVGGVPARLIRFKSSELT